MARNFYFEPDAKPQQDRLQADAYKRAAQEARSLVSTAGDRPFREILERLNQTIAIGRRELAARRVGANDIEAWDTSFRVMFLLCAWHPHEAGWKGAAPRYAIQGGAATRRRGA